uniref:Lipase/esterase n=1 Tax=Aspergillus pachycristatus TaxID=1810921 RepID=A0A5P8H547_9EURO|nr:lipase/esterase [Aspergillus pachycristatus]
MDSKLAEPWQQFVEELGFSPALDGPYETLMQGWKTTVGKLMSRYGFPPPDLSVQTEDKILGGVPTRIYTPPDVADPPLALYFHAGGWVMGSIDEEDGFVRNLCKLAGTRILSVGYRLAPEFRFPIPLDDCLTVARSALETYPAQSICFVGASAGGNMAFSTALALVSNGLGDRVQGVVALAPVTVHPDAVSADKRDRGEYTSYEENDRLTINTGSAMQSFFDCYGAPPDDPRLSCLLHPGLGKLNKVYMAVGGADTLRDDVRLMRDALVGLGVPVKCDEYPGYPHFSWLFPSPALREHQALFFGNLLSGMGWVCK